MKAMKWMLALVAMVLAVVSCSQKKEAPKSKVLVSLGKNLHPR